MLNGNAGSIMSIVRSVPVVEALGHHVVDADADENAGVKMQAHRREREHTCGRRRPREC